MSNITADKLRKSLLGQLDKKGNNQEFFIDLVNDYISMWNIKNKLIADVKSRGVSLKYKNGENQYGYKKNDSVRELTTINSQMLKILNELGIKAKVEVDEDDAANYML